MCRHSAGGQRVGLGQEEQRRLDALADVLGVGQVELEEDRVDVLLDGALGEDERVGDRGVALALGDLGEDLALASGERRPAASARRAAWRRRAARRSWSPAPSRRPRPTRSPRPAERDRGRAPSAGMRGPRSRTPAAPGRRRARRSCSGRRRRSRGASRAAAPPRGCPRRCSSAASGCRSPRRRGARCRPPPAARADRHTRRPRAPRARRPGSARRPRGRSGCHRPGRWQRAYIASIPRRSAARIGRMARGNETSVAAGRRVIWRRVGGASGTTMNAPAQLSPVQSTLGRAWERGRLPTARYPVRRARPCGRLLRGGKGRPDAALHGLGVCHLATRRPGHRRALPVGSALVAGCLHRGARGQRRAARRTSTPCRSGACWVSRRATWPRSSWAPCCCGG